ncbi:MAG: complex I NDUFA9 subunit family protein [Maricaulaceae bacterium]
MGGVANELVSVFGASGFIGRYVVRALAKAGYRIRAASRRPHLAHDLRVMGDPGQVQLIQANVGDPASIAGATEGADAVVNLVGVLFQSGSQSFQRLQAQAPGLIGEAAAAVGARAVVHVSAIGADAQSPAIYARTKAEGEACARAAFAKTTVLRPSIVVGPEDGFFNRFAAMARLAPALPLIGGGQSRFQPVYVGDVADAVIAGLERSDAAGRTYELGGPTTYTFKALMELMLREIARRRLLVPVPWSVAMLMGLGGEIMGKLPGLEPFLTRDQVKLLKSDNVVGASGAGVLTFDALGLSPTPIEAVIPPYLVQYRRYGVSPSSA